MNSKKDNQIRSILEIVDRMIVISEEGFQSCADDGCLLLNGMVCESAYRLRDAAFAERQAHLALGSRAQALPEKGAGVKKQRTIPKKGV